MNYLIMQESGTQIVPAKELRSVIDNGKGKIRIFRLCGMNDPVELFLRFFGSGCIVVDRFGNMEEGV